MESREEEEERWKECEDEKVALQAVFRFIFWKKVRSEWEHMVGVRERGGSGGGGGSILNEFLFRLHKLEHLSSQLRSASLTFSRWHSSVIPLPRDQERVFWGDCIPPAFGLIRIIFQSSRKLFRGGVDSRPNRGPIEAQTLIISNQPDRETLSLSLPKEKEKSLKIFLHLARRRGERRGDEREIEKLPNGRRALRIPLLKYF